MNPCRTRLVWRAPVAAASHRLGPARRTTIHLRAAAPISHGTPISVGSPFFPFPERSISKSWKRWPGRRQWSCQVWSASACKRGRLEPGLVCRAQIRSCCATVSLQSSRTSHQHRLGQRALSARFGPSPCRYGCCFKLCRLSTERCTFVRSALLSIRSRRRDDGVDGIEWQPYCSV